MKKKRKSKGHKSKKPKKTVKKKIKSEKAAPIRGSLKKMFRHKTNPE